MAGEPTSPLTEADATRVLSDSQSGTKGDLEAPSLGSLQLTGPALSRPLDLPAPETVLRRSELDQTRKTATAGVLFNVFGLMLAPWLPGDPTARMLFLVGLAVAALSNGWLLYVSSSEERYRDRWVFAYFALAPFTNVAILYYLGTFGPLLAMFVVNIYTACMAYRRELARLTLIASIFPVVVLGVPMALGLIEDPGLVSVGPHAGSLGQAVIVGAFVAFLLMTYQQANRGRELLVASLVERDGAVRQASHREALLVEARQELEQALNAGGQGRFSQQTLGSYRLGVVLGRGGMGEVYEATHVETGEPAAVKMLLPTVLGKADYVRRFLREVRVAASLDSPHVVKVLEVGDESAPMPYLAMERLVGLTLSEILRKRGRLALGATAELLREAGRGIEVASAAGIVHRDLKPQNLFRTRGKTPTWKILDFGISKLVDEGETLTRGDPIGTPQYMAPEQARGGQVDVRTDLYALGAIAYRAVTGYQPFEGDDPATILVEVLQHMPKRPSSLVELPADVDRFLAIAMAKNRADRFQTPAEMIDAFAFAIDDRLEPAHRARGDRLQRRHPWASAEKD